jgi:hypothetical protein
MTCWTTLKEGFHCEVATPTWVQPDHTFLSEQMAAVDAQRRALLRTSQEVSIDKVRQLRLLKGTGMNGPWCW